MAYTNVWDNSAPLGSQAANLIDDDFRALKVDIGERLTSIFGIGTLNALDPVAPLFLKLTGAAASKIIPGATSLSLRNNADSADNLIITDAGVVTLRNLLTLTGAQGTKFSGFDAGLYADATLIYLGQYSAITNALRINYSSGALTIPGATTILGGGLTVNAGGLTVSGGNTNLGSTAVVGTLLINGGAGFASTEIRGAAGNKRSLFYSTSGSVRWELFTNSTAEGGANAGSDFSIAAYDDGGSFIAFPLIITRATNLATFGGAITTSNGNINIGGTASTRQLTISANAGQIKRIVCQTGASGRWEFGSDATAESGGNAGSNFFISRDNDAGATIDTPFTIIRSDGQVQINVSASPALKISKNSNTNNFFIGLANTEVTGKEWRFVIDNVANGSKFGIWNFTDSLYGLQISALGVVTIGAQTAYPSANFTDGSNTLEMGWSGNQFFYKQTQATQRQVVWKTTSTNVLVLDYNTGFLDCRFGLLVNGAAASGNYLRGDGTKFTASTIQAGDLPTALTPTTLTVGGGSLLSKLLTGSVTTAVNGGASVGVGVSVAINITVTGASVGDAVFCSNPWAADDSRLGLTAAYVSSANTVTIIIANTGTVGTAAPTSRTAKAWVLA